MSNWRGILVLAGAAFLLFGAHFGVNQFLKDRVLPDKVVEPTTQTQTVAQPQPAQTQPKAKVKKRKLAPLPEVVIQDPLASPSRSHRGQVQPQFEITPPVTFEQVEPKPLPAQPVAPAPAKKADPTKDGLFGYDTWWGWSPVPITPPGSASKR